MPFCLQAKLDPVNGHSQYSFANWPPAWLAWCSLNRLQTKSEMPQQWRPVIQSVLSNSMAAERARTSFLKSLVQFQLMTATISLPNGPSLARLQTSNCSYKDCIHNQLALLKCTAGANHAIWTPFPCSMSRSAVIGEN